MGSTAEGTSLRRRARRAMRPTVPRSSLADHVPGTALIGSRSSAPPSARSPAAWSAATFYLLGCGLLVLTLVTLRLDGRGDRPVLLVLTGVTAAAGLVLLVVRSMHRPWARLVTVVVGLGVVTAAASSAATLAGLLVTSFGYLWAAIYIGYFFDRRRVYQLSALTAACIGVSLGVSQVADPGLAGVVVVTTVAAAIIVLRHLVEVLEVQAATDPLTGLLNRNGLEAAAAAVLHRQDASRGPASLAVLDLDAFSEVNNRLGHLAADRLLVELAEHWVQALGDGAVVARLGGDEFLILLPETAVDEAARRIADMHDHAPLCWSTGVVDVGDQTLEEAVAAADRLLFHAKRRRAPRAVP